MRQAKQYNWVLNQLTKYGKVSRNKALKKYITRLAHYINVMREEGTFYPCDIKTVMTKTANWQDCVYKVVNRD